MDRGVRIGEIRGLQGGQRCKDRRDTRTPGWTEVRIGLTGGLQGGQR